MTRLFSLLIILCFPVLVFSQSEEATTESGKKVILYSDGTWKLKPASVNDPAVEIKTKPKKQEKAKNEVLPVTLDGDCADLFESIKDKNNTVIIRTKNLLIVTRPEDRSEIDVSMQKGAKGIITVSFRTGTGSECIGEGNRISIVFADDSKMELSNDGPSNCRGESIVFFSGPYGKKKQLQELKEKKIRSVKIWTQQSSVTQEFSTENKEEFKKLVNCLIAS